MYDWWDGPMVIESLLGIYVIAGSIKTEMDTSMKIVMNQWI